jgi:hypothetical protein
MASEVIDAGAGCAIKLRRPWVVATFTVITLGVYWFFWYYKVNREMRDFGASRRDSQLAGSEPWKSVLAVTLGGLVVIPALVSLLRFVERAVVTEQLATGRIRRARGLRVLAVGSTLLPRGVYVHGAGALFSLCGFVALVVFVSSLQARLNTAWRTSALVALRPDDVTNLSIA